MYSAPTLGVVVSEYKRENGLSSRMKKGQARGDTETERNTEARNESGQGKGNGRVRDETVGMSMARERQEGAV